MARHSLAGRARRAGELCRICWRRLSKKSPESGWLSTVRAARIPGFMPSGRLRMLMCRIVRCSPRIGCALSMRLCHRPFGCCGYHAPRRIFTRGLTRRERFIATLFEPCQCFLRMRQAASGICRRILMWTACKRRPKFLSGGMILRVSRPTAGQRSGTPGGASAGWISGAVERW